MTVNDAVAIEEKGVGGDGGERDALGYGTELGLQQWRGSAGSRLEVGRRPKLNGLEWAAECCEDSTGKPSVG